MVRGSPTKHLGIFFLDSGECCSLDCVLVLELNTVRMRGHSPWDVLPCFLEIWNQSLLNQLCVFWCVALFQHVTIFATLVAQCWPLSVISTLSMRIPTSTGSHLGLGPRLELLHNVFQLIQLLLYNVGWRYRGHHGCCRLVWRRGDFVYIQPSYLWGKLLHSFSQSIPLRRREVSKAYLCVDFLCMMAMRITC